MNICKGFGFFNFVGIWGYAFMVWTVYIAGFRCTPSEPWYCFEQILKLDVMVFLVFVISNLIAS